MAGPPSLADLWVVELDGYRLDDGLLVPANDFLIARILRRHLPHVDLAASFCRRHSVVVQAGGNCGLWPRRLNDLFGSVYTFEPDPVNFTALAFNTAGMNRVIKMQAALGDERACVGLNYTVKNCGALYVDGPGLYPTLTIDDLGLDLCDLIYLDIEGSELMALRGARKTIHEFSPVIAFEDKGLGVKYGVEQGAIETWLSCTHGYRVVAKANDDTIMVRDC